MARDQTVRNGRAAPVIWSLAAAALFGASTPASKVLLDGMGPLALAGLLYLGAAVAVLPSALRSGLPGRGRLRPNLRKLAGAVLFGGILGPVLLLVGLSRAPAASIALWLNLETVATAILGWLFFREHLGRWTWIAVVLTVAAGVALASPSGFEFAPAAGLVGLACICWGLDNNLTSLIDGFTPAQTTLVKGLCAGVVNLGLALFLESSDFSVGTVFGALTVGGFGYGLSIVLYIRGAQHLGATRSQILFSTAPFLGGLFAWTFLREQVMPSQLIAIAVMLPALWILLRTKHEHEHAHVSRNHTHSHCHDDGHHKHMYEGHSTARRHTHEHTHEPDVHSHAHDPDLHHRHAHS
ncbi:MAG: DMT family transporter [Candidatus Aegiribacteria sp.]|nr:DMT family transporter [Candidatus Aegiribacteria sp.]